MKSVVGCLRVSVALLLVALHGQAQDRPAVGKVEGPPTSSNDPRVGLKAGFRDAGEAAKNLERIASLPKPEGFFDPKVPAGNPVPPERQSNARPADPNAPPADPNAPPADPNAPPADPNAPSDDPNAQARNPNAPPRFDPVIANRLGFANSDLAFSGDHLFVGNYHGFNTYDIERPNRPHLLESVVCPGGQGDVSVHGNLLIMSVE